MLEQVSKMMYNENPSSMTYLASKDYWVHETANKERSKIADGCYVYSSCSTNTKRSILTYLFKEMGIPSSVLEFELAPLAEKVTDSRTSSRIAYNLSNDFLSVAPSLLILAK